MTIGVLVMSYGTPKDQSDIARYYTDIRRGRAPSPEELEHLERRYDAIGGVSPLTERTNAQILALSLALRQSQTGHYACYSSTKHGKPTIEDAIAEMHSDRVDHVVGLVLAPHYSALSVGDYINRAKQAAASYGMHAEFIEHWHDDPMLIALLSERVLAASEALGSEFRDDTEVVFTAHSLPARIEADGDPYRRQLEETAELVAHHAGITHFRIGWQSAAKTGEPWLGPDISDLLVELRDEGRSAVIVCPAGFVSDHLEVLYDLDIVAHARAEELGLRFVRTTSLNDEPRLAELLAARVVDAAHAMHHDHGH